MNQAVNEPYRQEKVVEGRDLTAVIVSHVVSPDEIYVQQESSDAQKRLQRSRSLHYSTHKFLHFRTANIYSRQHMLRDAGGGRNVITSVNIHLNQLTFTYELCNALMVGYNVMGAL